MLLALALAALGDAAGDAARRASAHELRARLGIRPGLAPSGTRARLLGVFAAFPEDVATITLSLVFALANPIGTGSNYYRADSRSQRLTDLRIELGREPRPGDARVIFEEMIRRQTAGPSAIPETTPWDDLIPWIAREVMWVEREHPPAKRVRRSALFRALHGDVTLNVDLAERLLTYLRAMQAASTQAWNMTQAAGLPPYDIPTHILNEIGQTRRTAYQRAYVEGAFDAQFEPPLAYLGGHEAGSLFYAYAGRDDLLNLTGADLLREVHLERLRRGFPDLVDWVRAVRPNLHTMHIPEALAAAAAWHRTLSTSRTMGAAAGTPLAEVPGVGKWVELAPEDLPAESGAMKHCVGRTPAYAQGIRAGRTRILSLRNAEGRPLFTVELQKIPGRPPVRGQASVRPAIPAYWVITQWKGPHDRIPGLNVVDTRACPLFQPSPDLAAWVLASPRRLVRADLTLVRAAHQVLMDLGLGESNTNDLLIVNLADLGLLP
jgi:hypothetical protein